MRSPQGSKGFTLIEIIVVIILTGILASMALPRMFSMVEFSRSNEALQSFSAMRSAMERCYFMKNGTFSGCVISALDIDDPGTSANAHFSYTISGQSATGFVITATRGTLNGGDGSSVLQLTQSAASVTRSGSGVFAGIQ